MLSCHGLLEMFHRTCSRGSRLCEQAGGVAGEDRDCVGEVGYGAANTRGPGGVRNG